MTAGINPDNIAGIITELGGRTSHSAILARAMEIPAVLSIENVCSLVSNGDEVIVDGTSGEIILKPDEATIEEYKVKIDELRKEKNY
ncbi:MAG: PEP-utilizing enzyme [Eubacterium sp.]